MHILKKTTNLAFELIYKTIYHPFEKSHLSSSKQWKVLLKIKICSPFFFAVAYFITLVVIVSYLLVNIVVAAVSGVFLRVRHEHQVKFCEIFELLSKFIAR